MVAITRFIVSLLFAVGSSILGSVILGLASQGYYLGSFILLSLMTLLIFLAFTALEKTNGNTEQG